MDVCPEGLKFSEDQKRCVERCDLWTLNKTTGEAQCVSECPETAPLKRASQCLSCADLSPARPYLEGGKCVAACSNWWDRVDENGNCVSEAWRKSTAISVPIVVVVVAAVAVVLVVIIVRKKGGRAGNAREAAPEVPMREKVAGSE